MTELAPRRTRARRPDARPPVPSSLTPAQRARRQGVIDAALALLESRAYDKIQVKDVADRAGVALGTLYRYFSSKEHLFAEALITWAATLRTNISRHPLHGTTNAERLTEIFHRSVRAFQRQPQLARLVATLEVSSDPFATEILSRLGETTTSIYSEALVGIDTETAHAIIRVVDSVLASSLRSWVAGRSPIADVYDQLAAAVSLLLDPHPYGIGRRG